MKTEVMESISCIHNRSSVSDVRGLLVSVDPITIQQVSDVLQEFSISSDVCHEMSDAIRRLHRQKFDAVIVDLELGKESGLILDEVYLTPSNRTAVTFAIVGSNADARGTTLWNKAEFVLGRPLSAQSIRSILKPAYGLILRERRRYFRCPISILVSVRRRNREEVHCQSVNISEGGMSLSTLVPFSARENVQVRFMLPGDRIPFEAESRICWLKEGRIGVRFLTVSSNRISELQSWLSTKLEESLPEAVSLNFGKSKALP